MSPETGTSPEAASNPEAKANTKTETIPKIKSIPKTNPGPETSPETVELKTEKVNGDGENIEEDCNSKYKKEKKR